MLVSKKGAKSLDDWRLVVDYRKLNSMTKPMIFPAPDREAAIQSMHGVTRISCMDIQKAFHQIPMSERSKQYTAFSTHLMVCEFDVMPMGITNGPAMQQALMNYIFGDLAEKGVNVYIDDLIIYTKKLSPDSSEGDDDMAHAELIADVLARL